MLEKFNQRLKMILFAEEEIDKQIKCSIFQMSFTLHTCVYGGAILRKLFSIYIRIFAVKWERE